MISFLTLKKRVKVPVVMSSVLLPANAAWTMKNTKKKKQIENVLRLWKHRSAVAASSKVMGDFLGQENLSANQHMGMGKVVCVWV